jgi:thiamine-phosphate pyrophosphorylase
MRLPRLYPILDTEALRSRSCDVTETAEAMLSAGAAILQYRHKGRFSREVWNEAEAVGERCRRAGAIFVIDDRADVAMMVGAGVHVGQDDLTPAHARALIGEDRRLGFSTHNEEQLRASEAEPLDYVALGPIFATPSKRNPDPVLGVRELQRIRPLASRPLVAIGGITRENAMQAFEAGADSVAVIGDLCPEACTPAAIGRRTEEWLRLLQT